VIALVIALATFALTLFVRPAANFALKKELYNIAKSRIGTALKEKVFNDDFPKILIYVEEIVPPGNTAQGVLIVDNRDTSRENIILGKVARITTDEETNSLGLRLFDGSMYEREKSRSGFSQTRFNIYDFKLDLDELVGPVRQRQSGPKEMPLADLLKAISAKQNRGASAIGERMELHQRISFGFVPFIFCLLGVSLTLLPRTSRANRSWGFMLCLFWLMAYYALLSLGKALGDKNILHPLPATWLANLVGGAVGVHFFRHALREAPLFLPQVFENALATAGQLAQKFKLARLN
jgi:lipopolysaccharide export system permease protein